LSALSSLTERLRVQEKKNLELKLKRKRFNEDSKTAKQFNFDDWNKTVKENSKDDKTKSFVEEKKLVKVQKIFG
jgi:hypothetical protein